MSAPEKLDTRARLLGYSRWAAIALAVLAALTLALFSGETALRIAAFMAVIAVVLVVVSITMNGAASTKVHLEEVLLDEIDMLRDDVRADITTAARATHRAIAERVAHLHQNVEAMRRDADSRALGESVPIRPGVAAAPPRRAIAGAPAGVVHHTETVHVTTHQTYVDPAETERAERFVQRPPTWRPERDDRGDWEREAPVRADDRPRAGSGPGWNSYPDRDERRYAERDPRPYEDRDDSSTRRSVPTSRPPAREESQWSDSRRSDYAAPAADIYDDSSEIDAWRNSRSRSRDDDPADDDRWSAMRSGDRWAEVRTDERGRELRMGERRTAIRADETGTQMRIVDRWSTVRRENPASDTSRGYDEGRDYSDDAPSGGFRTGSDNTGETRSERRRREAAEAETSGRRTSDDQWSGGASERSRLALSASGPESAAGWMRGRDERDDDGRAGDKRVSESRIGESRAVRRRNQEISGEVIRSSRAAEPVGRSAGSRDADRRDVDHRDADRRDVDHRDLDRGNGGRGDDSRWSERARPAPRDADRDRPEPRGGARSIDPRGGSEPRGVDYRAGDARGAGPRSAEPRGVEPRRAELRGIDPRGVDPRGSDHSRGDQAWSAPRRPESRQSESRQGESRQPDPRMHGRDVPPAPREYSDEDNRWEREPSGGRSAVPPRRVDLDPNDDRWR